MNFFALLVIAIFIDFSMSDEMAIKSPCDDPLIYATDRLVNGSVRLYRDNHYWELNGLPGEGYLKGPFEIWYQYMAPITRTSSVMTVIEGERAMGTFKFEVNRYWAWNEKGELFLGGKDGSPMHHLPTGGLDAVFFNGNRSKPSMIAFKNIRVYYYVYSTGQWNTDGDKDGYVGGRYNENFPPDLTAAFSSPAQNPKDGYIAYLFKRDKYCVRPQKLKSNNSCDQWRDNKELFGCVTARNPLVPLGEDQREMRAREESNDSVGGGQDSNSSKTRQTSPKKGNDSLSVESNQSLALLFITICLILSFH